MKLTELSTITTINTVSIALSLTETIGADVFVSVGDNNELVIESDKISYLQGYSDVESAYLKSYDSTYREALIENGAIELEDIANTWKVSLKYCCQMRNGETQDIEFGTIVFLADGSIVSSD